MAIVRKTLFLTLFLLLTLLNFKFEIARDILSILSILALLLVALRFKFKFNIRYRNILKHILMIAGLITIGSLFDFEMMKLLLGQAILLSLLYIK